MVAGAQRQMVASGLMAATVIVVAGLLDYSVPSGWLRGALYAVALFLVLHLFPADRSVPVRVLLGTAALNAGALAAVLVLVRNDFGAYALSAAATLGCWSLGGWWLARGSAA